MISRQWPYSSAVTGALVLGQRWPPDFQLGIARAAVMAMHPSHSRRTSLQVGAH
jgi:hypothetical protein